MKKIKKASKKQDEKSDKGTESKDTCAHEKEDPYKGLQGEDLAAAKRVGWDKSSDKEW